MLYLIYIGDGTDLLLSEDGIILNHFSENTREYHIFEQTAHAVANHLGAEIHENEIEEGHFERINQMFEDLESYDSPTKHIAEFILTHSHPKENC